MGGACPTCHIRSGAWLVLRWPRYYIAHVVEPELLAPMSQSLATTTTAVSVRGSGYVAVGRWQWVGGGEVVVRSRSPMEAKVKVTAPHMSSSHILSVLLVISSPPP